MFTKFRTKLIPDYEWCPDTKFMNTPGGVSFESASVLVRAVQLRRQILDRLGVYNPKVCTKCTGSGCIKTASISGSPMEKDCPHCEGTGYVEDWVVPKTYP